MSSSKESMTALYFKIPQASSPTTNGGATSLRRNADDLKHRNFLYNPKAA